MKRRWVFILINISILATASIALAACPANEIPNPFNPTCDSNGCNSILCPVQRTAKFLVAVSIPLTAIMIVYAGFLMLTSAGDPEKFARGKNALVWAAIGFIIVLVSGGVALVIKSVLGG